MWNMLKTWCTNASFKFSAKSIHHSNPIFLGCAVHQVNLGLCFGLPKLEEKSFKRYLSIYFQPQPSNLGLDLEQYNIVCVSRPLLAGLFAVAQADSAVAHSGDFLVKTSDWLKETRQPLLAGVFAIGITQTKSAKRPSTGASVSAVSASVAHSGDFQAKTSDWLKIDKSASISMPFCHRH